MMGSVRRSVGWMLAFAALVCAAGCGPIGPAGATNDAPPPPSSAPTCTTTSTGWQPAVSTYDDAPAFGVGWWYIGQEPFAADDAPPIASDGTPDDTTTADSGDAGSDDGSYLGDDDDDDDGSYLGGDDDDDDAGDQAPDDGDSTSTQALHPATLGGACFTCSLTCTTKAPDAAQPGAVSGSGMSGVSHAAACGDAERRLRHYASNALQVDLDACTYSP